MYIYVRREGVGFLFVRFNVSRGLNRRLASRVQDLLHDQNQKSFRQYPVAFSGLKITVNETMIVLKEFNSINRNADNFENYKAAKQNKNYRIEDF